MPTPRPSDAYPDPKFDLYGGVAEGFNSRAEECLIAGPAGNGKTVANLLRVYWICRKYPRARVLIVRKTRESLTESVLVTWERDILGPTHPILVNRPILRRVRQSYTFANGSTVIVGGIDKPGKILSSEYDLIYCPEVTDLNVEDWETLGGRLRAGAVPYG
jgi:phage terminase large subunit